MARTKFLIIGGGNMGMAIAKGLLLCPDHTVIVKTPNPQKIESLIAQYPNRLMIVKDFKDMQSHNIDFCILAVKPYLIVDILTEASGFLTDKKPIIISVAAGISYQALTDSAPKSARVIRAMPNMPVEFGAGLFGYHAPERNISFETSFNICGECIYFSDEEKMHGFTALAGSGPAYLFHIIEAFSCAGISVGLSEDESMKIARQMIIGSALLANKSPEISADILRKNVTSPNGTTQAGLETLFNTDIKTPEQSQMVEIFKKTLKSAWKRSHELAKA